MRTIHCVTGMCLLIAAGFSAGCESFGKPDWLSAPGHDVKAAEELEHRENFQTNRSPNDARWLLSHRVRQGMSPQDVGLIFGDEGEPVDSDNWIKNDNSGYQVGDETYRWGPDNKGNSYYLVFRNNKLVNYDPSEFRGMAP